MADISLLRNEDMENTDEPMEGAGDEETGGDGPADGRGDEGGGEQLPPMTKLQQHASCNTSYNRQLVGRILVEVFRGAVESGTELNVEEVMDPVRKLVYDKDPAVRVDLVEQLPHVAMICQEAPDRLGDVLPRHLLRIIIRFLSDIDQQVRQSTHTALLALIDRGLLSKISAERVVAPTLLRMSRQFDRLELFTIAIDGISKVARILDEATAERLFLERYLELCKDSNLFIRRLCARRFGEFSAAMSKDAVYNELLPMYVTMCNDPVWSVRKSCADAIVSFACCVSLHHRRSTLSEILANFLIDDSKWVQVPAFQILGPFISTFAKQFTGFSYNQNGEFVLTDQYGTELRYNVSRAFRLMESPFLKSSPTSEFVANHGACPDRSDTNKENVPLNDPDPWPTMPSSDDDSPEDDATLPHDYDQFNPFRYYYISPELPLDSELVQAALIDSPPSTDSVETGSEFGIEVEQATHPIEPDKSSSAAAAVDDACDSKSSLVPNRKISRFKDDIQRAKRDRKRRETMELRQNDANDGSAYEYDFETDESHGDTSSVSLRNTSDLLNDTVDIDNISIDRSVQSANTSASPANPSIEGGQTIVPHVLVNFFVSMADPGAVSIGLEIPRHCAFSFPAVALTLGRENWPLLKEAYAALADAREYKVRRTMASSIHELAMILGEDLAARDLLPIYDGFIKDLDEVRIGALKHLTTFLKVLRPDDRRQFLPRLRAFLMMDNEWNWRFREEVASRLLEVIPLFTPADVSEHIAPLSFHVLTDKVAAVRHTALALITQIVSYLSTDEALVSAYITEIEMVLAPKTKKWTLRQAFALLCSSLISNQAISSERFGREMLPTLLFLSSDAVPNVRLAVATALSRHVINICDSLGVDQANEVRQMLVQMQTDPDRDVRIVAGGEAGKYYPQWKVPESECGW